MNWGEQEVGLRRKFPHGPWVLDGIQIDMYQLSIWIARHNREAGEHLTPSTVSEAHVRAFMEAQNERQ